MSLTNVMQAGGLITHVTTLADRLKQVREAAGLSQAKLAVLAGVSAGTIGNIEGGARKNPRELLDIAAALGVSAQWLKTGVGQPKPIASPAPDAGAAAWPLPRISPELWASLDPMDRGAIQDAAVKKLRELQAERSASGESIILPASDTPRRALA